MEKQEPVEKKNRSNFGEIVINYVTNKHFVKFYVLCLLTLQCASHGLVGRYSRGILNEDYAPSTTLIFSEGIKLVFALTIVIYDHKSGGIGEISRHLTIVLKNLYVFSLPAFLYFVQNLLVIFSLKFLDAPVFTIINQLKILTSAVFTVIILRRILSVRKWISLGVLLLGVVLVNIQPQNYISKKADSSESKNSIIGVISAVVVTLLSGFNGVFVELFVKKRAQEFSIWDRNIQLALNSVIFAIITPWILDGKKIVNEGYFKGYSIYTIQIIILNACGGILVAIVIKVADNLIKGFSVSCAIIISTLFTWMFWGFEVNILFVIGTILVVASIFMYMDYTKKQETSPSQNEETIQEIVVVDSEDSLSNEKEESIEEIIVLEGDRENNDS